MRNLKHHSLPLFPARFLATFNSRGSRAARLVERQVGDSLVKEVDIIEFERDFFTSRILPNFTIDTAAHLAWAGSDFLAIATSDPADGSCWEITTVGRRDDSYEIQKTISFEGLKALRLINGPILEAFLCVATVDMSGNTTLWRLDADDSGILRIFFIETVTTGGVWLDHSGELLAINVLVESGGSYGALLDLTGPHLEEVVSISPYSRDEISAAESSSMTLAFTSDAFGYRRAGLATLSDTLSPGYFPRSRSTNGVEFDEHIPAIEPGGRRAVLLIQRGATTDFSIVAIDGETSQTEPPTSQTEPPTLTPPGAVLGPVIWQDQLIRFNYTNSARTISLAELGDPPGEMRIESGSGHFEDFQESGSPSPLHGHTEIFPCGPPNDEMEAVVMGPPLETSKGVAIVLHGGPSHAHILAFDPLLSFLASRQLTVVAPNVRGSTNYGLAHRDSIKGKWGEPDASDIEQLIQTIMKERKADGPCFLVGISYGAFLALVVASRTTDPWSHLVAIAPFYSVGSLSQYNIPLVKWLLESSAKHGLSESPNLDAHLGPDLGSIRAKLLLIHGTWDQTVPCSESRWMVAELERRGKRRRHDFDYVEIPGGGHDLLLHAYRPTVFEALDRFLPLEL